MEYIAIDKSTYDDMLNGIKKTIKEIQSLAEVHNIQSDWVENGELAEMLGILKRQLQGIVSEVFWAFKPLFFVLCLLPWHCRAR